MSAISSYNLPSAGLLTPLSQKLINKKSLYKNLIDVKKCFCAYHIFSLCKCTNYMLVRVQNIFINISDICLSREYRKNKIAVNIVQCFYHSFTLQENILSYNG